MIQIKARLAVKASAPAHAPYLRPVGNGAPLSTTAGMQEVEQRMEQLSRAVTQSWVILDVPDLLIYKDRPKPALAWTALSRLAVEWLQRRLDALPCKRRLRLCVA